MNYPQKAPVNSHLPAANSKTGSIEEIWTGTNEQWWNWYLTLADNSLEPVNTEQLVPYPEPVTFELPSIKELRRELEEPYPISDHQIQQFQTESFIKLKHFISPELLYLLRRELIRLFEQKNPSNSNQKFSNMEMMWLDSDIVKEFVALLGIECKLYHVLLKMS